MLKYKITMGCAESGNGCLNTPRAFSIGDIVNYVLTKRALKSNILVY